MTLCDWTSSRAASTTINCGHPVPNQDLSKSTGLWSGPRYTQLTLHYQHTLVKSGPDGLYSKTPLTEGICAQGLSYRKYALCGVHYCQPGPLVKNLSCGFWNSPGGVTCEQSLHADECIGLNM